MDNELPLPKNNELTETSIHQALAEAAASQDIPKQDLSIFSVRLTEEDKAAAQFICERHGTFLGAYLRECVKSLVKDYTYSAQTESE